MFEENVAEKGVGGATSLWGPLSDRFTHRPWPSAPRIWGPRATLSYMTTQY